MTGRDDATRRAVRETVDTELDDADRRATIREMEAMMDRETLLRRVCAALHAPGDTGPLPSAYRRYYVNADFEAQMLQAQTDALATAVWPDLLTPDRPYDDDATAGDGATVGVGDDKGEGMEDPDELDDLAGVRVALNARMATRIKAIDPIDRPAPISQFARDTVSLQAEVRRLLVAFAIIGAAAVVGRVVGWAVRRWL